MVNERCDGCKFWDYFDEADERESADDNDQIGTCHRFPPVRVIMKDAGNDSERAYEWHQPTTVTGDWCGEFQPAKQDSTPKAKTPIEESGFSTFVQNHLRSAGFTHIEDAILSGKYLGAATQKRLRAWVIKNQPDSKSTT